MKYDLVMILRFVEKEKSLTLLQKTYNVTNDAPPLMKLKIAQNFRKATYKWPVILEQNPHYPLKS